MKKLVSIGVARLLRAAYRAPVTVRDFLSLLVMLGLVLAPAGMAAPASAMAMAGHGTMAMSHDQAVAPADHPCADKQKPAGGEAHDCCVMTCLGISVLEGAFALQPMPAGMRQPIPRMRDPHGLTPEADPPPPRLS